MRALPFLLVLTACATPPLIHSDVMGGWRVPQTDRRTVSERCADGTWSEGSTAGDDEPLLATEELAPQVLLPPAWSAA